MKNKLIVCCEACGWRIDTRDAYKFRMKYGSKNGWGYLHKDCVISCNLEKESEE